MIELIDMIKMVLKSNIQRGKVPEKITLSIQANKRLNTAYFEAHAPEAKKYMDTLEGLPVKVSGTLDGVMFIMEGRNEKIAGMKFADVYREGMVLPDEVVADNEED